MRKKSPEKVIPVNGPLSRRQRAAAKEAIVWLLGRGSYTIEEMAEHLGLTGELVDQLTDQLARSGRLIKERENLRLFDPLSKWWEKQQMKRLI